jgi:hypothetical protein
MNRRPQPQQIQPHTDAATLRSVPNEAERSEPPAVVRTTERKAVLINFKLAEKTAIALAKRAQAEGMTQKQWLAHLLAKEGLPVDQADLEDRSPRRRVDAAESV